MQEENSLKCLKCGAILQAPKEDRQFNSCKCSNRAWIQKRPNANLWAYGAINFLEIQRNHPRNNG